MPGLLIRDMPPHLYERLKIAAQRHHRSLTKEAIAILESALNPALPSEELHQPFHGHFPLTQEFLDHARREGRA